MLLRQQYEEMEARFLSPRAVRSNKSHGRRQEEKPCDVRTEFQRDRDRIIHSKSFRRLKHKTQVFIAPEGDHYRTRLTHTLEVSQISRTAARALQLNEDLTEAIALGHDLGHTPFGHAGEAALNEMLPGGFRHNEQSLRVVECLEGKGGLNLTWEVRDGILGHTGSCEPLTLEGQLVRICDRIAYINHDIDDALRAGILSIDELPKEEMNYLGYNGSERINTMIRDLMENSTECASIKTSPTLKSVMDNLRNFLFENVYVGSTAKSEEQKAMEVIRMLYQYWIKHPQDLADELLNQCAPYDTEQVVTDYIAGMTDRYIIAVFEKVFLPRPWKS